MGKFDQIMKNPKRYMIYAAGRLMGNSISADRLYLKLLYKNKFKTELHLDPPKTFNEKMQWLKLYDRKPIYTKMVDKYEAKLFIADKVGQEYVIPNLGIWDRFEDIDFDSLPDQFVLKCTHDSGGLSICADKKTFNVKKAEKKIKQCMGRNYYTNTREWPYKNVKPRIIAEQYMVDESGWELKDYKVFVFNEEPRLVEVDYNRYVEHKLNVYDLDWNYMDCYFTSHNDPNVHIPKPERFDEMLELSRKLAQGTTFLRVDFYAFGKDLYVGELTFTPGSGFVEFYPKEMDGIMGEWLELPI